MLEVARALPMPTANKKTAQSSLLRRAQKRRSAAVLLPATEGMAKTSKVKEQIESGPISRTDGHNATGVAQSPAMAWGSDQHTFSTLDRIEERMVQAMDVEGGSMSTYDGSPSRKRARPQPATKRGISSIDGTNTFLPDSVLYHPHSHRPLTTVNLSIWQDVLSTATVEDLLRRNSTFDTMILHGVRRKHDVLALVARHFGRLLTDIDISESSAVDDMWLATLGAECPSIMKITACRCRNITNKGIQSIARRKGTALQVVKVAGCDGVSDDGVELLAKHCTRLRSIDFSGCSRVRDRSVYAISSLVGLRDIALDGCAEVSDEAVKQLFTSVTRLKSLSIMGCSSISEEGLRYMHEMPVPWGTRRHHNCAKLETFRIGQNANISDEFIMMLPVICPKVCTLEIDTCPLIGGDDAMNKMGGFAELVDLALKALPRVSDQGMQQFFCHRPRSPLRHLSLAGCYKVTDVTLKCIAKSARGLEQLRLDRNVGITDRGLGYLAKSLVTLTLLQATRLGMVTDDGVRILGRKCLQLRDLDFSHCLRLTATCLPTLRRLRALEALSLSHCHGVFIGCPDGPQDNNSTGSGISGAPCHGVRHPTSTDLDNAEFMKLQRLDLSQQPNLVDAAVCVVARRNAGTLNVLNISYCSMITGIGVADAVKILFVLKRLDITGCTGIAAVDAERLAGCAAPSLLLTCARLKADGFDGLHCCASAKDSRLRTDAIKEERGKTLAAGKIQRSFRRYKERQRENEEACLYDDRMTIAAMLIQVTPRFFE